MRQNDRMGRERGERGRKRETDAEPEREVGMRQNDRMGRERGERGRKRETDAEPKRER